MRASSGNKAHARHNAPNPPFYVLLWDADLGLCQLHFSLATGLLFGFANRGSERET